MHTRRLMGEGADCARALQQLQACAKGDARPRQRSSPPGQPQSALGEAQRSASHTHTQTHTHTPTPLWGEAPRWELTSMKTKA